jgi:hypothetical protein
LQAAAMVFQNVSMRGWSGTLAIELDRDAKV